MALAANAVGEAKESHEPVPLAPMNPFERKVVHDAVAAAGLTSESEGEEPDRHVVRHAGLIWGRVLRFAWRTAFVEVSVCSRRSLVRPRRRVPAGTSRRQSFGSARIADPLGIARLRRLFRLGPIAFRAMVENAAMAELEQQRILKTAIPDHARSS